MAESNFNTACVKHEPKPLYRMVRTLQGDYTPEVAMYICKKCKCVLEEVKI